ncbi:hypothetical protein [Methanobacterium alcaliphilum]|uniref:hypothetical protein n=1 Tax=Methanobacterium alcaliphilum TaxID=392018 RepID=UPI00200AA97F|nr:hypothetical protein [Methanobacterium alcaliphilum]MCK9150652.1 hypothetical protein [Methanobacterium alcaliphilum]
MDSKGIASVDLLLATLVAFVIFGSFISLISTETSNVETSELARTRIVGEKIASAINTAYMGGNGYKVNITIPGDFNYSAIVRSNGTLAMGYKGQSFDILLIPRTNISYTNMTPGKGYTIRNTNGYIYFAVYNP